MPFNRADFRILVVDDEPKMVRVIIDTLDEAGYSVRGATSGRQAMTFLTHEPVHVVITDLKMEGMDGLALLREVKKLRRETEVIIMTAYATIDTAIAAMKQGAQDYVIKPFALDELTDKVNNIAEYVISEMLPAPTESGFDPTIIGDAPVMRQAVELAEKVAGAEATVLLLGESGTGKELFARRIHARSPRSKGSFVAINCASIPETLLESELFGFERGAFTGADKAKQGLFEMANQGSLFLDEIGEMPVSLQAKLLRVIQERVVQRVGSMRPTPIDVRLIAATNRNLREDIASGKFREDLFFRISVFPIEIPPLRNRPEDIPALAEHFISHRSTRPVHVDPQVFTLLQRYRWPGNVRELENAIERALILLGAATTITLEHFLLPMSDETQAPSIMSQTASSGSLHEMERDMLLKALEKANWNKTRAAAILGITRRAIYSRMQKHGLN